MKVIEYSEQFAIQNFDGIQPGAREIYVGHIPYRWSQPLAEYGLNNNHFIATRKFEIKSKQEPTQPPSF